MDDALVNEKKPIRQGGPHSGRDLHVKGRLLGLTRVSEVLH